MKIPTFGLTPSYTSEYWMSRIEWICGRSSEDLRFTSWLEVLHSVALPFMCTKDGYDVFLGGSCGETTWRQDIVIPFLRRVGISYYDPSQDSWTPEMIKAEELAKENSKVLLFVVDCKQANVVSFIEMAFLAARNAPLVVVLPSDEEIVNGFNGGNHEDRLRAVKFLRNVLNRHRIPQFKTIGEALKLIELVVIREKSFWDAVQDVRCRFVYMRIMTQRGMCKFSSATKRAISFLSPRQLVLPFKDPKVWRVFRPRCRTDWFKLNLLIIEVLLFFTLCVCCPAVPFVFILGAVIIGHIAFLMLLPVRWFQTPRERPRSPKRKPTPASYDVYLSGSGSRLDWITSMALPVLNKNGLSYMDASYCAFEQRLTMVSSCHFVLYVVSSTDTFLSGLVELAYFIGLGSKVIGCIAANIPASECLPQDLEDCGLTERMAENYRRGLLYLKDMAACSRVPIIENLPSALRMAIDRVRGPENGFAHNIYNTESGLMVANNSTGLNHHHHNHHQMDES